jgi:two-component system nitrate/nitrite sensor histidine kinase NarX
MQSSPFVRLRRSLLFKVGLLMTGILLLGLVSMVTTGLVARATEGLATAVNQSGALRMQAYRIGMVLVDATRPAGERAQRVDALAAEFARRLASPALAGAISEQSDDAVRAAYLRVRTDWLEQMTPALGDDRARLRAAGQTRETRGATDWAYVARVDRFVEGIDALVSTLEAVIEGRIVLLRLVQAVALGLTLMLVMVTMVLVRYQVIRPLRDLLRCADLARRGDFRARTMFDGTDELGRLGEAFNRMAADLSRLYDDLEARVREKTRDLELSNRSLDLLYRVGRALPGAALVEPGFEPVLTEIRERLAFRSVGLQLLHSPERLPAEGGVSAAGEGVGPHSTDWVRRVAGSAERTTIWNTGAGGAGSDCANAFAIRDQDRLFGVLCVDPGEQGPLAAWQEQLLIALASSFAQALTLKQRESDRLRLSVYEERAMIARELHDSLAQSLSYLKIQAARMDQLCGSGGDPDAVLGVLGRLREGLSEAYRQLRELLRTFRMSPDARGLHAALEAAVEEYRGLGSARILLEDHLGGTALTPHQEGHVLQILREGLANVTHHAEAKEARIRLLSESDSVVVTLEDDGKGMADGAARPGHYGLDIMRERAQDLGGSLVIVARTSGGTRVELRFPRRGRADGRGSEACH